MYTYNKQHRLCWIWLRYVFFCMCEMYYLLEYCFWKVEMLKHGTTMCGITCLVMHLFNVDDKIDLFLVIVHFNLLRMLCEQCSKAKIMLMCHWCLRGWHMECLTSPLNGISVRKRFYVDAWNKLGTSICRWKGIT